MGRSPRIDNPGDWKHVVNRGSARRTVFETEMDMRQFEALLELAVARGLIEIHVFALMTTHYHLLVRSPMGQLALAMHLIDNGYARWFNRTRQRDGPLWRGRYAATPVETWEQWAATLWYIDRNPVDARLVDASIDYPYCSAYHYARSRSGPDWLSREVVEGYLLGFGGMAQYEPSLYLAMLPQRECVPLRNLVARRLERTGTDPGPLDDLVRAAPRRVQEWMVRKARLADGTTPGALVIDADTLDQVVADRPDVLRWQGIDGVGGDATLPEVLSAGLYRVGCGMKYAEIAARQETANSTARVRAEAHRKTVASTPQYAALAAAIMCDAVTRDYGPVRRLFDVPRTLPIA